jgi:thiol-disulfide isomerase/thioredoxin
MPTKAMMEKATESTMMDSTATPDSMMAKPTEGAMMSSTAAPGMMQETPTPETMMAKPTDSGMMMETPMWFSTSFANTNDGKTFSINDFKGKVVLVETMAVWCTNCKMQQDQIKSLHEAIGMPADLVTVSLDIDPNENNDVLKAYVAKNGFDWMYAVAPADVSREISKLYGDQFLNPTSTPMLIIDRKGVAHPLPFGIKSADDLKKAVEPYLNGM